MPEQEAVPATEENVSTEVATRPKAQLQVQEGGVLPILPRNIEEAQRYASGLIAANIIPDAFRKGGKKDAEPDASLILMGVLKSMEIGVAPQTGLAGLLPLNGRFTVWGDLAAALVQRTGQVAGHEVKDIGPSFDPTAPLGDWPDEFGVEVRYWRKGQEGPYVGKFTVGDAKRAKLWMNSYKDPWIKYPRRMLFNRARALALRDGFSDGLHGLSIAEEVIDAMPTVEAEAAQRSGNMDALTADETTSNGADDGNEA